ncbi:MAG: hypothetical protein J5J00_12110 [Deltaproteobacteria bacterium]|nr:hypothetical protein [Deltaproteobacteria bacterium]
MSEDAYNVTELSRESSNAIGLSLGALINLGLVVGQEALRQDSFFDSPLARLAQNRSFDSPLARLAPFDELRAGLSTSSGQVSTPKTFH